MNASKKPLCLLACLGFLLCLPSTALRAGALVTAKGFSFFETGRELIAREKALDEAKRAALEQAIGTTVESRTAVENFQIVKDQIFTHTSGYFKSIKILEEKKTDLGTYEVMIEAEVEFSALVDDLDRLQKIASWQKNPRVSIVIEPDLDKAFKPTAQKVAGLLTAKLKESGLKVYKYNQPNASQMGLLVGLSIDLASTQTEYQGMQISLNEVSLNANIYRSGTQEILATASTVKSLPGENRLQVIDKGARLCVDAVWKNLRRELIRSWEKELYNEREIDLVINDMPTLAQAQDLVAILESDVSGMVSAELVNLKRQQAAYALKYRGWPQQFLNEIQMSYFTKKYFQTQLESIQGNKIVVNLK
jgi:hypothetical protein